MTYTQLRTQVDALCRKYAAELEVYRCRPLAREFCDEMTDAVTGGKPGPGRSLLEWAQLLLKRMACRGLRLKSFLGLYLYLEKCLDRRILPQVNDLLRCLFPRAAGRGLIPRSTQTVPF